MTGFVTTAIDYPNALPHIGTAFEKIGADAYVRFLRFQRYGAYFSMGNDENTVKVVKVAKEKGVECKAYVDEMATAFQSVWNSLDISNDDFIQTSEERHHRGVRLFLEAVHAAGYIEKRPYKALYCEGCEEFKTPNSLENGVCPNHKNTPLLQREEENWFFLLSKFKQRILNLIASGEFKIQPECRLNEMKKFIESDLDDISISRHNEGWGIPIPWDETQVTYVWFDALLNYLTVIGFGSDWEKFDKHWPPEVHVVGKDIARFHCAMFPAMLMAYNEGCKLLPGPSHELQPVFPERVFAHGFVYERKGDQFVKSSKSGNGLKPMELVDRFGADAYRYYFLAKFNFGGDGDYSLDHFEQVYNSDLANSLGNLVSRTVAMTQQYFDGVLPIGDLTKNDWLTYEAVEDYAAHIEAFEFKQALELVWKIISDANQHIDTMKPWSLAKTDKDLCAKTLRSLVVCLKTVGMMLTPFMPSTAEKIYSVFQWKDSWDKVRFDFLEKMSAYEGMSDKNEIALEGLKEIAINPAALENGKCPILFPRIK